VNKAQEIMDEFVADLKEYSNFNFLVSQSSSTAYFNIDTDKENKFTKEYIELLSKWLSIKHPEFGKLNINVK